MSDTELLAELRSHQSEIKGVLEQVRADNEKSRADMTTQLAAQTKWVVGFMAVVAGIVLAIIRFFPAP